MAKNFPYFKFTATEWLTGDIVFEPFGTQGLFINICALYWQRSGELTIFDLEKRYGKSDPLANLSDRFILVNDGNISIKFLDEQLAEIGSISRTNSQNGAKGGRPKGAGTPQKKATANRMKANESEGQANESKEEKKREEKIIIPKTSLMLYIENNLPNICLISKQLSFEESEKLTNEFPKDLINDKLLNLENRKGIAKSYTSVYLTLLGWCKKDHTPAPTERDAKQIERDFLANL